MNNLMGRSLRPFSLWGFRDGEFQIYTDADLVGHWTVLFFYPADFSYVCPTELQDLAEHDDGFRQEGCHVFSVSMDTHYVHKAWAEASEMIRQLPFVMLADPAGELAGQFGVVSPEKGQTFRATVLLRPDGRVKYYEVSDMDLGRNAAELLRKVRAARHLDEHGGMCPANWQNPEQTLMPELDMDLFPEED
jgi:peroxiredoxin (alkyl hydroperoxide reductase subunit C)